MSKICFIATVPAAVHVFLKGLIRAAAGKWSVKIVSHPVNAELLSDLNAQFVPFAIERKPSPWRDLYALIQLVRLFRREHFDLVHSITPKAGLLAVLAGRLAGVPIRIHTFTGQVWATKRGWKRGVLKIFDRLIVQFATHVLVDSPSQRDFLVSEGVLPKGGGVVIGQGSICGVDTHRFRPDEQVKCAVRAALDISPEQIVILFMGRLNREKGLLDLAYAFADIAAKEDKAVLLLVGAEEDVPFARVQELCGAHRERLRRVEFTTHPERYMAASDILCLPSYREGFGQVIIEAAASGVPVVASRIYGITDAVVERKTGLLYPPGDVAGLTKSLLSLIANRDLRQDMGVKARVRVLELFTDKKINAELLALYDELMRLQLT